MVQKIIIKQNGKEVEFVIDKKEELKKIQKIKMMRKKDFNDLFIDIER